MDRQADRQKHRTCYARHLLQNAASIHCVQARRPNNTHHTDYIVLFLIVLRFQLLLSHILIARICIQNNYNVSIQYSLRNVTHEIP